MTVNEQVAKAAYETYRIANRDNALPPWEELSPEDWAVWAMVAFSAIGTYKLEEASHEA